MLAGRPRRTAAIPVAALALVAALGCGGEPPPPARSELAVETAPAATRTVEATLPFVGTVAAARRVELRALAAGTVTAVLAADGARVRRGAVLFRLGGARLQARRAEAAAVADAAAQRTAAARDALARAERRAAAHLAAPDEVSGARSAVAAALESEARARTAVAELDGAAAVAAPFDGVLDARRVSAGQAVAEGDVLGSVLDPGRLRVEAAVVPDGDLSPEPGQRGRVSLPDGTVVVVRVAGFRPVAGGGGVAVWLEGDGLAGLLPGTAVRGEIVTAVRPAAVVVPDAAVVRGDGGSSYVFVGEEPPFSRRQVTTGVERDGVVELRSGVEAGETVVVRGAYELYWASFATTYTVED